MAMTAQGLMLSLAGVSVAPMMAFHARSRADLIRGRSACPLAIRQRMPERFMRWVTRVLLARPRLSAAAARLRRRALSQHRSLGLPRGRGTRPDPYREPDLRLGPEGHLRRAGLATAQPRGRRAEPSLQLLRPRRSAAARPAPRDPRRAGRRLRLPAALSPARSRPAPRNRPPGHRPSNRASAAPDRAPGNCAARVRETSPSRGCIRW